MRALCFITAALLPHMTGETRKKICRSYIDIHLWKHSHIWLQRVNSVISIITLSTTPCDGLWSSCSDVDHYVIIRKLLDSIFNINGIKNCHNEDLVEHTRVFLSGCLFKVGHTLTNVLNKRYQHLYFENFQRWEHWCHLYTINPCYPLI
jgi:hypothetical protein